MLICGLKLTHDGSIAIIENQKLVAGIEMEKLNNNARFTSIEDTAVIEEILKEYGYQVSDVDYFVVDGWGGSDQDELAIQPRLQIGADCNHLTASNNGIDYKLDIERYEENNKKDDVLKLSKYKGLRIGKNEVDYYSSLHVAGHIAGTYCTSPFAEKKESSYILVWDGGMYPRLYYFDYEKCEVENLGPIFLFIGNIYTIFSQHFGPFKVKGNFAKDNLSVAGKVMAYIALGKERKELFEIFERIYEENYSSPMGFANVFTNKFKKEIEGKDYSDEDILSTFHAYMEQLLVDKLEKKIARFPRGTKNICLAGGCALNIKWNSAVRNSGSFDEVYVSPFPNDSGSAIGTASLMMLKKAKDAALDWTVYSGPSLRESSIEEGWRSVDCSIEELAELVYQKDEPVVFLNGRAELGPRALGNRSIIANPTSHSMKTILNRVKKREDYRPVSPICLEHRAQEIFEPGTKDPFMLFDHYVKPDWLDRIPAVCHLDETARLQTINEDENPVVAKLLIEYEKRSKIPLLCNTSANLNGSGFFPDVKSAMIWDKVNYIWSDNKLYERCEKLSFNDI